MEKFWNFFWKIFGAMSLLAIVIGIISGIVQHSGQVTYLVVQKTIAVGVGISGVIGLFIMPLELYLEDRKQRRNHE
jgi:hypothetical protein